MFLCCSACVAAEQPRTCRPLARTNEAWWVQRVAQKQELIRASGGTFDIVMLGDSITHYWEIGEGQDESRDIEILERKYRILNCGFGGDRIENLLWRVENGELDGYRAKLITLMIGTNNYRDTPTDIVLGVRKILDVIRRKQPDAKILLMGYLPCGKGRGGPLRALLDGVRPQLKELAKEDPRITWFDCSGRFLNPDGTIIEKLFDGEYLHPSTEGYRVWREELEPVLDRLL